MNVYNCFFTIASGIIPYKRYNMFIFNMYYWFGTVWIAFQICQLYIFLKCYITVTLPSSVIQIYKQNLFYVNISWLHTTFLDHIQHFCILMIFMFQLWLALASLCVLGPDHVERLSSGEWVSSPDSVHGKPRVCVSFI